MADRAEREAQHYDERKAGTLHTRMISDRPSVLKVSKTAQFRRGPNAAGGRTLHKKDRECHDFDSPGRISFL